MSKKTRLCPFRKVVERERFQPCIGHKCMAYVYTLPLGVVVPMAEGTVADLNNWGCARLLKGDSGDGA